MEWNEHRARDDVVRHYAASETRVMSNRSSFLATPICNFLFTNAVHPNVLPESTSSGVSLLSLLAAQHALRERLVVDVTAPICKVLRFRQELLKLAVR